MDIKELLSPDAVLELREPDKWHVLKEMAHQSAAKLGVDTELILRPIAKREDLGSTGLGNGIALPHARINILQHPFGLFALLRPSVQFDAIDDRPVDLVFLLLLPESPAEGRLTSLACVARRLRDPVLAGKLRTARGALSLYALLTES